MFLCTGATFVTGLAFTVDGGRSVGSWSDRDTNEARVLLVGGTGTVGRAVAECLLEAYYVVVAARSGGDVQVDGSSLDSIKRMFGVVGDVDAVVSTFGHALVGSIGDLSESDTMAASTGGAIEGFCRGVSADLGDRTRINCVSPVFVLESGPDRERFGLGDSLLQTAAETALAYQAAIETSLTGHNFDPRAV